MLGLGAAYKLDLFLTNHSLKILKTTTVDSKPPKLLDGNWGQWSAWTTCTVSCGGGNQTRTRQCDNPSPANGGSNCPPETDQKESLQTCGTQLCPIGRHVCLINSHCSHALTNFHIV